MSQQLKSWFSTKDASGLERTVTEPYVFESAEDNVVKIEQNPDKQYTHLKKLTAQLVELEGEAHRIDIAIKRVRESITQHRTALATNLNDKYQEVGINVPIPREN